MKLKTPAAGVPQFYIPATSSLLERRPRTLKHGDVFAMFAHYGDISGGAANPEGLYHHDTRFLSLLRLEIDAHKPLLLSSCTVLVNFSIAAHRVYRSTDIAEDLERWREPDESARSRLTTGCGAASG